MEYLEYNDQKLISLISRLWRHLNGRMKFQFMALLSLMFFSTFAEIVSLGAVIPFIGALTAPRSVLEYRFVGNIASHLDITSPEQLIFPITVIFILAIVSANGIRLLFLWFSSRLSLRAGSELSVEAFHRTLCQPYIVHVGRNSSEVITGMEKVRSVAGGIMIPVLFLVSSAVILIAIMATLLTINTFVTSLTFFGFGFLYLSIILGSRKKIDDNGKTISNSSVSVQKIFQEGLGGIRDLLLDGTQKFYSEIYRKIDIPLRTAIASNIFFSQSPKYFIDGIGISLFAAIAYKLNGWEGGITGLLPVLGAIVLGAQRLLPTMQIAYASWSTVVANKALLADALYFLEQKIPSEQIEPLDDTLDFAGEIKLDHVGFQYSANTPVVLENITLSIKKGEKIGFIGETGSGKSTTLDLIMGLLEPTKGSVLVDGRPLKDGLKFLWRKNISHVPQFIYLSDNSIAENIAFGIPPDEMDWKRLEESAQKVKIADFIQSLPDGYNTLIGERGIRLSGGQRQRIGIARALYKKSSVLVLDEATNALDAETENAIMDNLENFSRDHTLLIIAHRQTTLKSCDRIFEIKAGKIAGIMSYEQLVHQKTEFNQNP